MYLGLQADVTEELTAGSQVTAEEVAKESAAKGSFETARMQHQQVVELLAILQTWQAPQAGLEPLHAAQSFGVNPSIPSSLMMPLLRLRHPFVLSNPRLPDGPICHASPMFLALTQYSIDQVVGRNCRFLQGPGTDADQVLKVREAVHSPCPHPVTVRLLNYRRDGTPFWNNLHVAPIRDNEGQVAFFVGVQLDITLGPSSAAPDSEQADMVRRHTDSEVTAGRCQDAASGSSSACLHRQPEPLLSALSAPCALQAADPSDKERRAQQSVVAAVRVACRSLGAKEGLRRSADFQQHASMDTPLRRLVEMARTSALKVVLAVLLCAASLVAVSGAPPPTERRCRTSYLDAVDLKEAGTAGLPSYSALARTYKLCLAAAEPAGAGRKLLAAPASKPPAPPTEVSCRNLYLNAVDQKEAGVAGLPSYTALARTYTECRAEASEGGRKLLAAPAPVKKAPAPSTETSCRNTYLDTIDRKEAGVAGLPGYTALARTYTECRAAAEVSEGGRKLLSLQRFAAGFKQA
ncbi:hypothetical protein WJX73_009619 [Symbiochloris irregularis]|uniref:PAC domain-containing protein n=1 Tax=Symbiochloris irregularis TaxID=706552 RepID=A0AAW1P9S7_9CHLO